MVEVAQMMRQDVQPPWDQSDPAQPGIYMPQGVGSVVYGGSMSTGFEELQLVRAWRPTPSGEWQLDTGVIHRVQHENQTATVQFLNDQHRSRVPFGSMTPILDITPTYPKVRLAQGDRLPTRVELLQREQEGHARRQALGIPPNAPLPGEEGPPSSPADEVLNEHGQRMIRDSRWGIPGPTLDALRNRSIPGLQVGPAYGPHFYTKLYSNNFYAQDPQSVSSTGHVGLLEGSEHMDTHIISHHYVPLEGPELVQDLRTGNWHAIESEPEPPEPKGWLQYLLE